MRAGVGSSSGTTRGGKEGPVPGPWSSWRPRGARLGGAARQGGRGAGGEVPVVQGEHHVDGLLLELGQVGGADVTAAVTLVPRSAGTVGDLELVMEEEGEGGILAGVWTGNEQFQGLPFQLRQPSVAVLAPHTPLRTRGAAAT